MTHQTFILQIATLVLISHSLTMQCEGNTQHSNFKMMCFLVLYLLAFFEAATASSLCTDSNTDMVARVVFGEARGESSQGQLSVAYTVVNRVGHAAYPNNVTQVVNQKVGSHHQYNTLDDPSHDSAWASAKAGKNQAYKNAVQAAGDALCKRKTDPTTCATDYCAYDPCSATNSNRYYEAYNKTKIGKHYFVCRRPVSG